jgi:hypothetical protein
MGLPTIFIGSSVESLPIAQAIQANLEYDAKVTLWDQGVFKLNNTALESLYKQISEVDFAIFVFMPEDIATIRDTKTLTVRDNVIFEMGLFIGGLGKDKVYYLIPRGVDFHLPTDLLGITSGTYNPDNANLQAATGTFCTQIKQLIKKLYSIEYPLTHRFGDNLLGAKIKDRITIGTQYVITAQKPPAKELRVRIQGYNSAGTGLHDYRSNGVDWGTIDHKNDFQDTIFLETEGYLTVTFDNKGTIELLCYIDDEEQPSYSKTIVIEAQ